MRRCGSTGEHIRQGVRRTLPPGPELSYTVPQVPTTHVVSYAHAEGVPETQPVAFANRYVSITGQDENGVLMSVWRLFHEPLPTSTKQEAPRYTNHAERLKNTELWHAGYTFSAGLRPLMGIL